MKHLLHKLSSLRLLMLLAVLLGMGSSAAWGQDLTFDFEDDGAHRSSGSNSYTGTNVYSQNDVSITLTYADAVTTGSPINGTANAMGRVAKNTTNSPTIVIGPINNEGYRITGISCQVNGPSTVSMAIHTSTDNSNWTSQQSPTPLTGATIGRSVSNLDITSSTVYLKFTLSVASTTSSNRDTKIDDIVITREAIAPASPLASIALSGEYPTTFLQGDAFSHEGMTVTATYDDTTTKDVTASAEFTGYDMSTTGNQTVTVSYTENEVTKTIEYDITVNAPVSHNVTWSVNGETTVVPCNEGAAITFPENPADISGKTFVGWVAEAIAGTTNEPPTFVTSATMGNSDVTYYAVFAYASGGGSADVIDELDHDWAGVTGTNYSSWSGNTATSSAVYAGNTAGGNDAIQLRSNNNNSGIVTTTSGGKATKVTVEWNSNTSAGRTLNVYGKNSAYSTASDLYNSSNQGTLLGTIVYDTSTELTIDDDYEYIGIRSASGAMYLNEVKITWSTGGGVSYSDYCTTVAAETVARPNIEVAANPFLFSTTATITCETEGAAIKYSFDGETWNDYTDALTITETTTIYAKAVKDEDESTVASVTVTKNKVEPTVTIDATGITNTNVFDGTEAGSLAAAVTYNDAAVEGAIVTWSGDNDEVATIDASTGAVTLVAAGTVTFTATYAGNSDYSEKAETYVMTVTNTDPNAPGTENNPYTVAQARAAIDAGTGITNVYATGIVSQAGTVNGSGQISYYISADGSTTSDQLQAYKGRGIDGASFESDDDIQVGDVVVIYGTLKKYNAIYEFDQNNQLVSLFRKTTPGLEWSEASFTAKNGEENAYPTLTNTNGVTVTYSSTDEAVATIDASTGVITLVANGNTTIKATFAGNEDYLAQEVSYELTVKGFSKDAAGINFIEESYEFVYNDDDYTAFEGQALTNPNNLDVVWSSDDEEVAIVDDTTGEVVLGQPGTATITATFTEDEDYLGSVVSYTITINKAEAGLSFDGTSFMVAPNGDFTEPTFNNPNDLTVEWTSTNEDVAYVYGGEVLIGSKEGTATITASFAGNDYYNAGNASYTITVSNILLQTWDLSTNSYSEASEDEVDWTSANVTMIATKYDASTPADNYLGGDANKRTSSRFYKNSKLTITPAAGYQISSVEFTATSTSYATALNNSAWTNAKAIVSGTTVTVTPVYGSKAFEAVIGGTCGFTSVTVTYQVQTQETVVIGTAGYTSFTTEFDVDFEGTGVTAYIATAVNSETIHLESVTEAPAGTALILQAAPETYLLNSDCEGTTDLSSNLLLSSDGTVEGDGSTIYALGVGKVAPYEGEVGFYVVNDGQTVPAGKAYLTIAQASSVKEFLTFDFGELPTGLNDVRSKMEDVRGEIFNLAGQKMNRLQKGINIVNGKKIYVK